MEHYFTDSPSGQKKRESFEILTQGMMNSLNESEQDADQQSANCEMSGPGRTHFLPIDRQEISSHYFLHDHEKVIPACKSAIKAHQCMYNIDPNRIHVSYKMYFAASQEMSALGVPWNGTLQYTGIAGSTIYISMQVHNHVVVDMVICIH